MSPSLRVVCMVNTGPLCARLTTRTNLWLDHTNTSPFMAPVNVRLSCRDSEKTWKKRLHFSVTGEQLATQMKMANFPTQIRFPIGGELLGRTKFAISMKRTKLTNSQGRTKLTKSLGRKKKSRTPWGNNVSFRPARDQDVHVETVANSLSQLVSSK